MRTPSMVITKIKDILKTEGPISLVKKIAVFLISSLFHFRYGTYYLYEHPIGNYNLNEADFMPRMQDFTLEVVSTNQQASELAGSGFEDIRLRFPKAERNLDNGAIAFCVFHGLEITHICWIALTERAKSGFDHLPYQVYFLDKQACTGGTFTEPKYRGKGLMTYGYFKRFEYLREHGITSSRNAVETSNISSQRVHAKFGPNIYARARYIKILRWRFWKEIPVQYPVSIK